MDGSKNFPNEWSKSDTERQISYDIVYMWDLFKKGVQMNLNGSRVTDKENKLMVFQGIRAEEDKLGE